jgi:O-antigen/teichoic acid export membrane protein
LGSVQLYNTLLSFLIYPLIIRKVGLEAFGLFTIANYFAGLMGTIINFGTSQSGVKDIVINKEDSIKLSSTFYTTISLRLIIFITFVLLFSLMELTHIPNYSFYFFAIPLILSEVLNPMFLFLGKEKLAIFNITNLVAKILTIVAIFIFIQGDKDAIWINFIIGSLNCLAYIFLIIWGISNYKISYRSPQKGILLDLFKTNFYLVGNNISVHLQQSLLIFAINIFGNPLWLGAYAICDKIIGAVKTLISTLSNSMYPRAIALYKQGEQEFLRYKRRMKKWISLSFLAFSILLSFLSPYVILLLNGHPDENAENLLRIMAFLPFLAALNVFNVLECLIRNDNVLIFRIAMILLILATALAWTIVSNDQLIYLASYSLIIETGALLLYEFSINRKYGLNS